MANTESSALKVTSPDAPPPLRPVPAVIPVISPVEVPVIVTAPLDPVEI